jgi:hypothetical protein
MLNFTLRGKIDRSIIPLHGGEVGTGGSAGGSDRHGKHQSFWIALADCLECSAYRRTRGNAIIDHDNNTILNICARSIRQIELPPALDLGEFGLAYPVEIVRGNICERDDVLVAYDVGMAAVDHRAHGKLGLEGNADLAHEQEVQRDGQCVGDLGCDNHAASWKGQNYWLLARITGKFLGESAPCVASIPVDHGRLLFLSRLCAEIALEPLRGMLDNVFQCPRLAEQVSCAWDDFQRLWLVQYLEG